jgi:hypothetical protein
MASSYVRSKKDNSEDASKIGFIFSNKYFVMFFIFNDL